MSSYGRPSAAHGACSAPARLLRPRSPTQTSPRCAISPGGAVRYAVETVRRLVGRRSGCRALTGPGSTTARGHPWTLVDAPLALLSFASFPGFSVCNLIQPIPVDIATHCLRSASAAYPGLIMGTDATSMHWAPIGQPESTDTEHVVAADRLTSSKGASAIAQPSARRGERARSSSKGRSSNGTTPVTPCVQPRPRRAPAALNPPTPLTGRRTDALRLG